MVHEDLVAGLAFTWKNYQAYSGYWEHEHCRCCWRKFLDPNYADWMREALQAPSQKHVAAGYANVGDASTPSGRYWVCGECFEDFKPQFGWEVVASDPDAWPYDTPEPSPRPTAADFRHERWSQGP